MSVPQSTSKKDPAARARLQAARAAATVAKEEADAREAARKAAQAVPLPPSSVGSHQSTAQPHYQQHPPSPALSFGGGSSVASHYSAPHPAGPPHQQPYQPQHQQHQPPPPQQQHGLYASPQHGASRSSGLNVPPPNGVHGRPVSPQAGYHTLPPPSNAQHGPPRHAGGGRPLSSSGPPRSALMQVPAPPMAHSASQGSLPVSAAYNVDRDPPLPIFSAPASAHPPPPAVRDAPLPPLPDPRQQHQQQQQPPPPLAGGHPQEHYYHAQAAIPPAQLLQQQQQHQHVNAPPSAYPSEPDSRRATWASLAPGDSASNPPAPSSSGYASSTYGGSGPHAAASAVNAVAGPSSVGEFGAPLGQRALGSGGEAPVASAKRSAESLIGLVRNVRQILFRRSTTDQYLIRTVDIFASNLMGHTQRLIAREMELTGQENRALSSIARDFDKAAAWMQEHQQDIAINWPPDRTVKAVQEMDERLTKAFTSKLAVALFEALQDTRQLSLKISRQLDGLDGLVSDLPGLLSRIMSQANSAEIDATISRLRVEEDALKPLNGAQHSGYGGGEAEKTIQSLLDALEALRLSQAEKEARSAAEQRILNPNGYAARGADVDQASLRSLRSETELSYNLAASSPGIGAGGLNYVPAQSLAQVAKAAENWPEEKKMPLDDGGIYFQPVDPITKLELIDPVLADDGCIHDRFSVVNHRPENPLFPGQPLRVLGDVLQLRKAIFARYPERKDECFERRAAYLASTIKAHDEGYSFLDCVDQLDKLSTVLDWQKGEEDCGVLVRRGILRWRLRNLAGARADLQLALALSPTLPIHHLLAIVHLELRDRAEAERAVELALARDGRDAIACAVRSQIHSFYGRISAATRDAEAASQAANHPETDGAQSSRVTKTTYTPHPSRTMPDTPLPELPDLPNLMAGFAWLSLGEPIRASNHIAQSVDRGVLGDPWPRCLWGYILTVSSEEDSAREEGIRELEASWKLSGDIWKRGDDDGGLRADARPLQASIGILLAQAKAQVDQRGAKQILVGSLKHQHPLQERTSEEVGFLAGLHAETGDYESASAAYDEAVFLASKSGRMDERAALLAERSRHGV